MIKGILIPILTGFVMAALIHLVTFSKKIEMNQRAQIESPYRQEQFLKKILDNQQAK